MPASIAGRLCPELSFKRETELAQRLAASDRDRVRWHREAQGLLQGLGFVMEQQLETWHPTPAEKEIALFLIKGLSHKEIAKIRGSREATARQQARSVYRKAGCPVAGVWPPSFWRISRFRRLVLSCRVGLR